MADVIANVLAALLPAHARNDLFRPAWTDHRIAKLEGKPVTNDVTAATLIFFDCWRLILVGALSGPRDQDARGPQRRAADGVGVLLYHLRHATRRLIREPGFSLSAMATLAIGIGANIAVFSVVEAVLLRPLPYPAAGRLVVLQHRDLENGLTKPYVAIGDYVDLVQRQQAFSAIGGYGQVQATILDEGQPHLIPAVTATAGFMDALGVRPIFGRSLEPQDAIQGASPVAIIGYDFWRTHFRADSSVLGQTMHFGRTDRTIVGVLPPGTAFPPGTPIDAVLSTSVPTAAPAERKSDWTFVLARLRPGINARQATAQLATISRALASEHPASNSASTYYAQPFRDSLVGDAKVPLMLAFGVVAAVLLIALGNVANLLLARAIGRQRKMAVREALGASRSRLVIQLMSESLTLAGCGTLAGVAIARWGVKAIVLLVPKSATVPGLTDVRVDAVVVGFAATVAIVATILLGLVGQFAVGSPRAPSTLVTGARASMSVRARRTASYLVGAEVAFAMMLLVGAGFVLRTFAALLAVDPGFHYDHLLRTSIALPAAQYKGVETREGFYARALPALAAIPDVESVGAAAVTPLTGNNWTVGLERVDRPLPAGQHAPDVGWQVASGGFFPTLGIPLIDGRLFNDADSPAGRPVAIVSKALADQYFPRERAVGHQILVNDSATEIIGVVGDIRRAGLRDAPRPELYLPFERSPSQQISLFVRTRDDPLNARAATEASLRRIEPQILLTGTDRVADLISDSVRSARLLVWLLGTFAAVALVLALIGIYGVLAYAVRLRAREIGTRIALGAPRGAIVRLVMAEGLGIATAGAMIGVGAGLVCGRLARSVLFETSAVDPMVLGGAPAILLLMAALACYIPARRAAAIDPARTLGQP